MTSYLPLVLFVAVAFILAIVVWPAVNRLAIAIHSSQIREPVQPLHNLGLTTPSMRWKVVEIERGVGLALRIEQALDRESKEGWLFGGAFPVEGNLELLFFRYVHV